MGLLFASSPRVAWRRTQIGCGTLSVLETHSLALEVLGWVGTAVTDEQTVGRTEERRKGRAVLVRPVSS